MGATAYLSWRSASADDAEWMSGKSRARLAPVLTDGSSWMSDLRAQLCRGDNVTTKVLRAPCAANPSIAPGLLRDPFERVVPVMRRFPAVIVENDGMVSLRLEASAKILGDEGVPV